MVFTSTNIHPMTFYRNRLTKASTAPRSWSSDAHSSQLSLPGFRLCTASTVATQIPVEESGKELGLIFILSAVSSADYYPQVDIQRGNVDYAVGGSQYAQLSSHPDNWVRIVSTAPFDEVTSYDSVWTIGPLDIGKYACNFGGTSSNSIDKRQNFVTFMIGYSSLAAGIPETHAKMTTNAPLAFWVGAVNMG
jgi:hypothetical protein